MHRNSPPSQLADKVSFGKIVLGPIFAEFCLSLWTLLSQLNAPNDAVVLFCARGGLRLRLIYERFLASSGLTSPAATKDLMVSRVVSVRAALLANCASAFEQIGYELGTKSLRDVTHAISGIGPGSGAADQAYTQASFVQFLSSDNGRTVRANIQLQADLFREHLSSSLEGRSRALLCDSGLSGSTMQLLEDGIPEIKWGCILFARSNYKKFSTPHFARTMGLAVDADCYSPFNVRTAVLRYWHLIEATLEPALPSVALFERIDGTVRSNLEIEGWRDRIAPTPDEFLAGILAYLDELPPGDACARILGDVDLAYAALRRAVIWPTRRDVDILDVGARSVDFGRTGDIAAFSGKARLAKALRNNVWKEGGVANAASSVRWPLLAGLEAAHAARWARRFIKG